jgi:hypothetical protein
MLSRKREQERGGVDDQRCRRAERRDGNAAEHRTSHRRRRQRDVERGLALRHQVVRNQNRGGCRPGDAARDERQRGVGKAEHEDRPDPDVPDDRRQQAEKARLDHVDDR